MTKVNWLLAAAMLAMSAMAASSMAADEEQKTEKGPKLIEVSLRVDGNLAGHVTKVISEEEELPARARISIVRDSKVVHRARTNEFGHFQVVKMDPGIFTVIAEAGNDFGVYAVKVLPYVEKNTAEVQPVSAAQADMPADVLKLQLKPVAQELGAEPVPVEEEWATASECCGGGAISGGGGAGALAGLGGLAGLAGLAGLGGTDSDDASPADPVD